MFLQIIRVFYRVVVVRIPFTFIFCVTLQWFVSLKKKITLSCCG